MRYGEPVALSVKTIIWSDGKLPKKLLTEMPLAVAMIGKVASVAPL